MYEEWGFRRTVSSLTVEDAYSFPLYEYKGRDLNGYGQVYRDVKTTK